MGKDKEEGAMCQEKAHSKEGWREARGIQTRDCKSLRLSGNIGVLECTNRNFISFLISKLFPKLTEITNSRSPKRPKEREQ